VITLRLPRLDEEPEFLRAHHATSRDVPTFLHHHDEGMPFERYLAMLADWTMGKNLPSVDHVPSTFLFAFVEDRIVGRVAIRHHLNAFLEQEGGHIGYVVVPQFQRRGFGTEILRLALIYGRARLGLTRVLITCDDDNIGSIKVIERNGGVLQDIVSTRPAGPLRRYWVQLSNEATPSPGVRPGLNT
jgi:predicted acetyltransferase